MYIRRTICHENIVYYAALVVVLSVANIKLKLSFSVVKFCIVASICEKFLFSSSSN
jgi:hypothetical protein